MRTPEGTLAVDATGKANGRGAYLKKDLEAVEKAKKNGSLARALEVKIPDEFWDTIRAAIR